MWNPSSPSRSAIALAMAAAVAFLGSSVLLKAGRALPHLASGGKADGQPGSLLLAAVALLAVSGGLLLAMAARELLWRRRLHPAAGAPRRRA